MPGAIAAQEPSSSIRSRPTSLPNWRRCLGTSPRRGGCRGRGSAEDCTRQSGGASRAWAYRRSEGRPPPASAGCADTNLTSAIAAQRTGRCESIGEGDPNARGTSPGTCAPPHTRRPFHCSSISCASNPGGSKGRGCWRRLTRAPGGSRSDGPVGAAVGRRPEPPADVGGVLRAPAALDRGERICAGAHGAPQQPTLMRYAQARSTPAARRPGEGARALVDLTSRRMRGRSTVVAGIGASATSRAPSVGSTAIAAQDASRGLLRACRGARAGPGMRACREVGSRCEVPRMSGDRSLNSACCCAPRVRASGTGRI